MVLELLDKMQIKEQIVTIDAIETQKTIAKKIRRKEDYAYTMGKAMGK